MTMIHAASGVCRHLPVSQAAHAASTASPRSGVDHSRGYPVGDGSFANQVRGTQPQPERDLHFAMMANDAYALNIDGPTGTRSEQELAKAGWQRLRPEGDHLVDAKGNCIPFDPDLLRDEDSGFDAAIYQNEQGQYVVAYRGTDNWFDRSKGGRDGEANVGQGAGYTTKQYRQAVALAMRAEEAFGPGNVAITGHSLGGGLASAAMLAADMPGVTFNAAGLSDNTLRSLNLGESPNTLRAELANSGQIRRYNVEGEMLTTVQQGTPLPDAVGHELRVAAPAGMGWNPVERHGGGGDNQSYVEGLRESTPYRPFSLPPELRMVEQYGEFKLNLFASKLGNLYDVGYHTGQVVRDKQTEIGQTLRTDFANGQVLAGTARVAGQLGDGVLDIGGGVVREVGDYAGDVVMETSTLGGNYLRNLGQRFTPLAPALNAAASFVESAGEKANQVLDKVGEGVAWAMDKAGDGLAWLADRAGDGLSWATSKVADGVTWVVDKAANGAAWVAGKAADGVQWLGEKLNPANWFGAR